MMRKLVILFLAVLLLAGLCGCDTSEKDKAFPLPEESFYDLRLSGLMNEVKKYNALEPYLMVSEVDVMFQKEDGRLRDIQIYLYGYDENKELRHGYLIATVKRKDTTWVEIHPQVWNPGEKDLAYDARGDFTTLCAMVDKMDLRADAQAMSYEKCGILSEGVRNFGYNTEDLYKLFADGTSMPYAFGNGLSYEIEGLSLSVYSASPDTGMPAGAVKRYIAESKGALTWNGAE